MFEVCCRLCLEQAPLQNIHSLYGKHKEFVIRDKIYELFQIQFSDTEKLSTVCNCCLGKIETVDGIRDFFLEADKKFKQFLASIEDHDKKVCAKLVTDKHLNDDCKTSVFAKGNNSALNIVEERLTDEDSSEDQPAVKEEASQECSNHRKLVEIEMVHSEHESEHDPVMVDICENYSESEISVLGVDLASNLAEHQSGKMEDDEFSDHQDVVIYTSDQSCEGVMTYEETRMSDIATDDEEINMKDLVEVDNDRTASIGATGDEEFSIVTIEFQCNVCGEIFEDDISFIQHTNTFHFPEYPHHCKHCYLVFKTNDELTTHECAKKLKIMVCSECPERFQTIKDLRSHTKNIHGPGHEPSRKTNLFKCDFCDSTMTNNLQLISHGQFVHPDEFELHQCDRCEKTFGNMQALRVHMAAHERNFECSFCSKVCPTAVALAGHENTHTKEQPFQCSQCGRNFAQYTSMRRHMKIHFNEKAYQCDFCSKRFRQRTVMLTHRRIHTGEKPFACETCSKTFRDHSTLAKHKRIHEKKQANNKK
ncbi:zinc finger protein 3 homolog isoform X2 [Ochlerotatus camptorhynchus]|uniref:zinc finger protein 3 homolog isoform X2 n=1 Tax=Ochlerotatus camptorhynchus TaxID=644619 RepID=UPI0031D989A6